MSRHIDAVRNLKSLINALICFVAILVMLNLYAIHGLINAPKEMTHHIPPDLSRGVTFKSGYVPSSNVYAFAYYIVQQLHRWPNDGSKDYGENIFKLQAFITPECREYFTAEMNKKSKNGELSGRTRALSELAGQHFSDDKVKVERDGAWKVLFNLTIVEHVNGVKVKNVNLHYPIRVVQYDVDRERNPWGWALDCFDPEDQPIPIEERKAADGTTTIVPASQAVSIQAQ